MTCVMNRIVYFKNIFLSLFPCFKIRTVDPCQYLSHLKQYFIAFYYCNSLKKGIHVKYMDLLLQESLQKANTFRAVNAVSTSK
jgi:hypothetical protein